ncbi:HAD family hydrolase [uncultured Microbacterium sp.]|uniref:HAD family hydrolase n=1 Tax=uncultured Microbacterium sp. TaxID=191216 RepID=UPI0025E0716A|nr:HAD-IA family hydrolase [uncultured Microbacterium sp.]
MIVFVSLLGLIFTVVEWVGRYRALRSLGIEVRRGWFRWWALWAWSGAACVLLVLASIPPLSYVALSSTPFHLPFTIVAMLVTFAVMLAFWPGVVTVARFVIRVHNAYARHEFEQASARFDAELESDAADGPGVRIDEGVGVAPRYRDPMPPIRAMLFDLDGVVRHFDPENVASIERAHELEPGAIEAIAFAPDHLEPVTTGKISRREWVERVGAELGNAEAAEAWGSQPFHVDEELLGLVDELRASGIRTAILTNGTDTIPDEIASINLGSHFEAVFNSAEIGWTKPDVRAFQHVLDAMQLAPHEVFFTDDSVGKLVGADALGMLTHHFAGVAGLRETLRETGLLD